MGERKKRKRIQNALAGRKKMQNDIADRIIAQLESAKWEPERVVITYYDPDRGAHSKTEPIPYRYACVRLELMKRANPGWTFRMEEEGES